MNMEKWEMRSEGCKLLHYWNDNSQKLCNTIKHNIVQTAPPKGEWTSCGIITGSPDYCTACMTLITEILNKKWY